MRKAILLPYFLSLIFLPLLLCGQADIRFRHFGKKNGLSQNSVFAIAQDGRGVMWFGTREGLNEFDGYRFTVHRHIPDQIAGLPSDDVRSLAYDATRNCLWVGTLDGLARYDFATNSWINYKQTDQASSRLMSQTIRHIMIDSKSEVWVSTARGLSHLKNQATTFQDVAMPANAGVDIKVVLEDQQHYWIGTDRGLYLFPDKENLEQLPVMAAERYPELAPLADLHLKTINKRTEEEYWFGTQVDGIWCWNKATGTLTAFRHQAEVPYSLSHDNIRSVTVNTDGTMWVGTYLGLNQYLPEEKGFRQFLSDDYNQEGLRNSSVRSVFIDNRSNLWIGTYYGGVHYLNEEYNRFRIFQHQPGINSLSFNVVSSFAEAPNGDLWIGTEGGGLNFLEKETGQFSFIRAADGLQGNNVKTLLLDGQTLHIGVFGNGLHLLNTESKQMRHFLHDPNDTNSLVHNNVYALLKQSDTLWVGTYGGGLNQMNLATGQFIAYQHGASQPTSLSSNLVRTISVDAAGKLWIGTEDGLNEAIGFEDGVLQFQRHLENIRVYSVLLAADKIWVGTFGQGLFSLDQKSKQVVRYTEANGLPGNAIFGILPDEKGKLWLSTNNGISRFDPEEQTFTNYSHMDGLENLEFNYNAAYRLQSGAFLFGGTHGFTRFRPEELRPNTAVPSVIFTGLTAFNRAIEVGGEDGILQQPLNEADEIVFNYGDANFTLQFAAVEFTNPAGNRFAYRMKGLQDEWAYVTGRPEATYTLQQEGTYTFELRAANKEGIWNPEVRSLQVRVLPPLSRTWWAYLLYLLGAVVAGGAILRIIRLRQSYKLEQLEKQQQAELHQMKTRFFTNVAHEFRTPLTLIIGPLEDLLRKGALSPNGPTRQRIGTIYSNAQRMLDLVNQLLTFQKMEAGHEPLQVEPTNLHHFLKQIFDSFEDYAQIRAIDYQWQATEQELVVWLDREKMNKVLFNLLSNAFKFTADGGAITLQVRQWNKEVMIVVKDSGVGIDPAVQEQIFQRFYEKTPGRSTNQIKGTGIGLALSRQLVGLHQGRIELESKVGAGATFSVYLPLGKQHFSAKVIKAAPGKQENEAKPAKASIPVPLQGQPITPISTSKAQPLLLVVEDNPEVQAYIRSVFAEHYQVITANDGIEGLAIAQERQPDLLLSDVMMPRMDGFELCRQLKTNLATSHIPIILLTAKTALNDRLEGLEIGADDYVPKPFHPAELRLKVRNRLLQRQRQREQFSKSPTFAPKEVAVTSADEAFLKSLVELVEANIDNPNFSIEQFAQELAVSRALLFTKVKVLTDTTPKNFLKSFRLKRAAQLLETGKLNVSEVAYRVGFKEPKYFSKVFQKAYGCNPSEFVSQGSTLS